MTDYLTSILHCQHLADALVACIDCADHESLSSCSRAFATSSIRDAFFQRVVVFVPNQVQGRTDVAISLGRLAGQVRNACVGDTRYLSHVRRWSRLEVLRLEHRSRSDVAEPHDYLTVSAEDLNHLLLLPRLKTLHVGVSTIDLVLMAELRAIEHLHLAVASEVQLNVDALAQCQSLKTLELHTLIMQELVALHPLRTLEHLTLTTWVLQGHIFPNSSSLRYLDISQCGLSDLSPLALLPQLRTLDIHATIVQDLRPLRQLQHLESLNASQTKVTDIQPLAALCNTLLHLNLSQCPLTSLVPLQFMWRLETLQLHDVWQRPHLPDLSVLSTLRNLRHLNAKVVVRHLSEVQVLQMYAPLLRVLQNLESLELSMLDGELSSVPMSLGRLQRLQMVWSFSHVSNLPLSIRGHPTLQVLHLHSVRFDHLTNLSGVPLLRELRMTDVEVGSLEPLRVLVQLEVLVLSSPAVGGYDDEDHSQYDLTPLSALSKLLHLDLSFTSFHHIDSLRYLHRLEFLGLSSTNVFDLAPIAGLHQLRVLELRDTNICMADTQPLLQLYRLRKLALPDDVDCMHMRQAFPYLHRLEHNDRDNCLHSAICPFSH